jgi:hypothetical protein
MRRRYVRNDADLPDHDLVLELADIAGGLAYHVRHYVHHDAHVVIVGGFGAGPSYRGIATRYQTQVEFASPRLGFLPRPAVGAGSMQPNDFVNHQTHGVVAIRVGDGMPRDVSAVVSAVDEACAAYECLHIATEA